MPIDDERRRFTRPKTTPRVKPQTVISTKDEAESKDEVQESLQRLQDMLLLQQGERAEFREEEEKRLEAHKLRAQRTRNERNEKYERLQRAFERMNRWKEEEKAELAEEESKRAQGTKSLSYISVESITDG